MAKKPEGSSRSISRRDFLKLTGAVVGSSLIMGNGQLSPNADRSTEATKRVNAAIEATPIEGGWEVNIFQGAGPDIKKARIYRIAVKSENAASSSMDGRQGTIELKRDSLSGSFIEIRDVTTNRVHSTKQFRFSETDHASLIGEGVGSFRLPNLGTDSIYVFAVSDSPVFNPNTDSWIPFSATNNPDLRFSTNIFL